MTSQPANIIVISPIGDFSPQLLHAIGDEIKRIFGYPTEIMALLSDLSFALDPNRNQYHSTSILDRLANAAPSNALKLLGITQVDLFIPILTHVYGEAQLGGQASILSTFRLNEGHSPMDLPAKFQSRILKEAVHELGHTFKLRHCQDPACIMHYCRSERDVDLKSDQLCRYCKTMLEDEIKRIGRR